MYIALFNRYIGLIAWFLKILFFLSLQEGARIISNFPDYLFCIRFYLLKNFVFANQLGSF